MPPTLCITNVLLPTKGTAPGALYDLECRPDGSWSASAAVAGAVLTSPRAPFNSITELSEDGEVTTLNANGSLVLPGGLVHPHLHLDKCFLLDRCKLDTGTFGEALSATSEAKASFTEEDLYTRGRKLIRDSLSHGVTIMRCHVEIDPLVSHKCLYTGLKLQKAFAASCSLQLVAFAQDPFFYPSSPTTEASMSTLFDSAIALHLSTSFRPLSAVGSAPYVEASRDSALRNIALVFALAKRAQVDVDFHLDYDLDPSTSPLLWDVLQIAKASGNQWDVRGRPRRVTLGHCTKLSLFGEAELVRLGEELKGLEGQVHFVALPPSDMFMQGRGTPYAARSRATFPALELVRRGIPCSIGVNNVGNGFTPQGDADPLALLPMLVAVWQSAQPDAIYSLLEMVTTSAALAAGADLSSATSLFGAVEGDGVGPATFTILDGCVDVRSAVFAPSYGRTTVFEGRITARRTVESTVDGGESPRP